jgi:hypothetical protein
MSHPHDIAENDNQTSLLFQTYYDHTFLQWDIDYMQVDLFMYLFTSRDILMHEIIIHFNYYLLIYSFLKCPTTSQPNIVLLAYFLEK